MKEIIIKALSLVFAISLLSSCECSNSSKSNHHSIPTQYNSKPFSREDHQRIRMQLEEAARQLRLQEQLKQFEEERQPAQRIRIQRSDDYDRGYRYGWDVGYEDAYYAYGAWANYNSNGKGGDFLDGYENGYIDGYESGKEDREDEYEDDYEYEEVEDL